ncbi:outer membrane lipid asymmetry maintenance protein MlaD [Meridianimarinicoccus aquatilis]|uniref:Outer membrane lipid asymmetry maintenance protein MlaD n=1 Tax=Meridianimarinicoccus aquatilis TaxID=2552766 RepID=A0A4R6B438_9RHOB|nr:outer membrane lipid asymmetry maintenance protein MlaD [Fluviibacterium aquatile]QIE41826.1 outer membrane lipid asymmetry maintenance protein MlaD [Rhodobacteraceae bacterium SC52]TDL89463.1 outer membrane lipid asymmetry maintenance protein MlaD [Fluviibacterium aquatile]
MSENRAELVVGAAVLAVAIGFLAYATSSVGAMQSNAGYSLTASFRSAQGIGVGTDVQLAGVKVGTVTAMELNPETFRADAVMTIRDGVDLPDDSSIIIASEGLLGGNFVEVQPGGSPFNFEPGDTVSNTQGSVSLIELLSKFVGSGSD